MRRIGVCEERGSGWDKVVLQCAQHQLPIPLVEVIEGNTRVVLFGQRPASRMSRTERLRAMYFHACLRYVNRRNMNNASVRERFGIDGHNSSSVSRLIAEALSAGMIQCGTKV